MRQQCFSVISTFGFYQIIFLILSVDWILVYEAFFLFLIMIIGEFLFFSPGLIVWLVLSINFWSINPSNFTTFEQHILTNHIVFNMIIKPTNNKDGSIIMNRDRILDKYTSFIQSIDQSIQLFSISVNDIEIEKWTYSFLYCGFICFLNPLSMIP